MYIHVYTHIYISFQRRKQRQGRASEEAAKGTDSVLFLDLS
jgi:hypothetical protein